MKKHPVVLLCGFVLLILVASVAMVALDTQSEHGKPEPQAAGIHWAKGQKPIGEARTSDPNLVDHLGGTISSALVTPIFWGTSWSNSAFIGDKIQGISNFYSGMHGSKYATTTDEFTGEIGDSISTSPGYTDTTVAKGGNQTAPILAEVCKVVGKLGAVTNGYYPVYVDVKRGGASFCAWHSYGTCGGTTVYFGFFFNLDGDAGCDPQDKQTGHSQGLAALANVSGHELSEARTDPRLNAWYDKSGQENADKCAWVFDSTLATFTGGTSWKVQGNWSNKAYTAQSGYANSSGQKGCIDGNGTH